MTNDDEDTTVYKVVVNHEEQYSIWPASRDNPSGWRDVGKQGQKAECLAHIKEIWTDMRPLSLRRKMEQDARARSSEVNQPQDSHEVDS
jgi:MbtH protein